MSSPFYTVLLFKGSKMTVHIHTHNTALFFVCEGIKTAQVAVRWFKKNRLLLRWLERRVRLGKHPIKVPLEGTHWIKPKVFHIGFLYLWILLLGLFTEIQRVFSAADWPGQTVVSGAAKLDVVVNLQRGGDRVAQHFRGYSWRLKFLSLKYPNAWAVRVSGGNGEL